MLPVGDQELESKDNGTVGSQVQLFCFEGSTLMHMEDYV